MVLVIGIDLGGTKIAGGLIDAEGSLISRVLRPTDTASAEAVLDGLVAVAADLQAEAPEAPVAVGVGVPGTLDRRRGRLIQASNLPLHDVALVDALQERLGLPVAVDNDANLAALAEHLHGAARRARHSLLLTLGTGVGGGVIIDDRVFRGATGAGAELGHVSVERDGPPCPGGCPNHGCLEVYASGPGIGMVARRLGLPDPEPRSVNDRALAGDGDALAVLQEVGRTLGVALASFANVFDPEMIVLGGGVSAHVGHLLLPVAVAELRARALRPNADQVEVVLAELGAEAGLIGAGDLARLEATRC